MNTQTKKSLLLLGTSVIWGLAFVAQSAGGELVGPFTFTCIRNLMGSAVLLPIMLLFDRIGIAKKPQTRREKHTLLIGGVATGLALFVATNLQQLGITMGTSAGKAGFLTACYIILVPILGIFLHKKCPLQIWLAVFIALIGLYLLCMEGSFSLTLPDLLLLLCALAYSVQILCVDYYAPITDAIRLSCIEFLVCGLVSAVPMFFFEIGTTAATIQPWIASLTTMDAWIPILYAGICSSGIAYTLQVFGQRDLNPTIASLVMSLESVFSVLGGWIILHQTLSIRELLGCVVIFIAIILSQLLH